MQLPSTPSIFAILASILLALYLLGLATDPAVHDGAGISPAIPLPGSSRPPVPAKLPEAPETRLTVSPETDTIRPTAPQTLASAGGWVGNEIGASLEGVEIEIEPRGLDGEEIIVRSVLSNRHGEFTFSGLVPGRQYRLNIEPQADYAGFSVDSFSADAAEALNRIFLKQVSLVDVDGMIVDVNSSPVANFEFMVRSLSAVFPDRTIRSDATGYFSLKAFPAGELRIATSASDYYRIKGLELRPDEYRNLTLVIDRGSHYLSGLVSDEFGTPLHEARVTLKSAFKTGDYHSFSYRSAITDASGAFAFSGLGGNRLTLGVYANGFVTHIQRHDFVSFADRLEIRLKRK